MVWTFWWKQFQMCLTLWACRNPYRNQFFIVLRDFPLLSPQFEGDIANAPKSKRKKIKSKIKHAFQGYSHAEASKKQLNLATLIFVIGFHRSVSGSRSTPPSKPIETKSRLSLFKPHWTSMPNHRLLACLFWELLNHFLLESDAKSKFGYLPLLVAFPYWILIENSCKIM